MIKVNDIEIVPTIFPDGTSQVWKIPEELRRRHVFIEWDFQHEGEIMHLAQLQTLLGAWGVNANLTMRYLPYARQDKTPGNGQTFALHAFARLINELNFCKVSALDPHSAEAGKLIKNFHAINPRPFIEMAKRLCAASAICYPDTGASLRHGLLGDREIICQKVRDEATGRILEFNIGTESVADERVLIVDDICDGGATFILAADALIAAGAAKICLYVTHGIFSRGLAPLLDAGITRIFTKDGEVSLYHGKEIVFTKYQTTTNIEGPK